MIAVIRSYTVMEASISKIQRKTSWLDNTWTIFLTEFKIFLACIHKSN